MEKRDNSCLLLVGVTGLVCLLEVLIRAFWPAAVLPRFDLIWMAGVSLLALAGESWRTGAAPRRCWWLTALTGILSFGLLPLCGRLVPLEQVWPLALAGGAVFLILSALFTSLERRLATAGIGRLGRLGMALLLFLACQGFGGILL